jgi:hypothetical protein
VTLSNSGNGAMTLRSIVASGDFAETNTCGASVAAGANCTISVTFKPTAGGTRNGTLTITDNAPGSPHVVELTGTGEDFNLAIASGSSSSATVSPGQAATYTISLTEVGGLSQAVSLACSGAPSEATCTVNPTSATPNGSGSIAVTVTVTTTAPSFAAPRARRAPPGSFHGVTAYFRPGILSVLVIGILALLWVWPERKRRTVRCREFRFALALGALAILTLLLAACGGGGGGGGGGTTNPGTAAGSYTLTITGTLSGSTAVQHSTTLTLQVS